MRYLVPVVALAALAWSGCVVETTSGCPGGCPTGTYCGGDGLCHTTGTGCPGGCPTGSTCGADGLCHSTAGTQPIYASCGTLTCAAPGTCYSVTTTATSGGSFCSETCTTSAQCPAGAHGLTSACLMLASAPGSPYLCYPGCATDADCQTGTSCIPVTGGATGSVCMPGAPISTGAPTYASCSGGGACAAPNTCYTVSTPSTTGGSFCSATCTTSAACPLGAHGLNSACLMLATAPGSPYLCYPGCNNDGDCQAGTSCTPVTGGAVGSVCMPGAPISLAPDYAHCTTSSDCQSGLCAYTTVTTTTGGSMAGYQCTRPCASSAACAAAGPYGAACLMLAGTASDFYCYTGCAGPGGVCPGSGVCTAVTGGASGYACFPNG